MIDARKSPAGTLVVCEHCPTAHPKGDDDLPCLFPKLACPKCGKADAMVEHDDGSIRCHHTHLREGA